MGGRPKPSSWKVLIGRVLMTQRAYLWINYLNSQMEKAKMEKNGINGVKLSTIIHYLLQLFVHKLVSLIGFGSTSMSVRKLFHIVD